jgi:hypothetical protein
MGEVAFMAISKVDAVASVVEMVVGLFRRLSPQEGLWRELSTPTVRKNISPPSTHFQLMLWSRSREFQVRMRGATTISSLGREFRVIARRGRKALGIA